MGGTAGAFGDVSFCDDNVVFDLALLAVAAATDAMLILLDEAVCDVALVAVVVGVSSVRERR